MNNTGVEHSGANLTATLEEIESLIALNATAVSGLARIIGVRLAKGMHGGIIFHSSLTARPRAVQRLHLASKAFVLTLSGSRRTAGVRR